MGAWGTGIKQNDTFQDLIIEFRQLYNDNVEIKNIPEIINQKFNQIANDDDEYSSFWMTMAFGQWDCGSLQEDVLQKVIEIYETNKGLDLWRESNGAEKGAFDKHKKAIAALIDIIKTPSLKPKKRKKIIPRPCYFKTGDCISVKMSNGLYGAAYVLDADDDKIDGHTIIAFADYFEEVKPTVIDIVNARLLKHDYCGWPNNFAVKLLLARTMTKKISKIDLVGAFKISEYAQNFLEIKFKHVPIYDIWWWSDADEMLTKQYDFNINREKTYQDIKILELISENCDSHWNRFKGYDIKST